LSTSFPAAGDCFKKPLAEAKEQKINMNTKTIVAALLITSGIVVLAYSGISFSTPGKPIDFLGMHIETTHSHFIPPVVGAFALVGGIVLLLVKPRQA
jgi:uncharacterized membrane protein YdcZ (DUF606 family)